MPIVKALDRPAGRDGNRSAMIEQAVRDMLAKAADMARDAKELETLNRHADRLNREAEEALSYQVTHDPKTSRVFVVVGRQILTESRYSTVVCAPMCTNRDGLATQVSVGAAEGLKHGSSRHCARTEDPRPGIDASTVSMYKASAK